MTIPGVGPVTASALIATVQDFGAAPNALPALADTEARMLRLALEEADGNLSLAARLLSISRPTLAYRLRKHKIGID